MKKLLWSSLGAVAMVAAYFVGRWMGGLTDGQAVLALGAAAWALMTGMLCDQARRAWQKVRRP